MEDILSTLQNYCTESKAVKCREEDFVLIRSNVQKLSSIICTPECRTAFISNEDNIQTLINALQVLSDRPIKVAIVRLFLRLFSKSACKKYGTSLVQKGLTRAMFQTLYSEFSEPTPNEDIMIRIHQILCRLGPFDKRFGVRARISQCLPITFGLLRTQIALISTLNVVNTHANNASSATIPMAPTATCSIPNGSVSNSGSMQFGPSSIANANDSNHTAGGGANSTSIYAPGASHVSIPNPLNRNIQILLQVIRYYIICGVGRTNASVLGRLGVIASCIRLLSVLSGLPMPKAGRLSPYSVYNSKPNSNVGGNGLNALANSIYPPGLSMVPNTTGSSSSSHPSLSTGMTSNLMSNPSSGLHRIHSENGLIIGSPVVNAVTATASAASTLQRYRLFSKSSNSFGSVNFMASSASSFLSAKPQALAVGVRVHSKLIRLLLSTFHCLIKWKNNAGRANDAGAISLLLDLFLDAHRCDLEGRRIALQRSLLTCLRSLTVTRNGRKFFILCGGLHTLFAICMGYVGPDPLKRYCPPRIRQASKSVDDRSISSGFHDTSLRLQTTILKTGIEPAPYVTSRNRHTSSNTRTAKCVNSERQDATNGELNTAAGDTEVMLDSSMAPVNQVNKSSEVIDILSEACMLLRRCCPRSRLPVPCSGGILRCPLPRAGVHTLNKKREPPPVFETDTTKPSRSQPTLPRDTQIAINNAREPIENNKHTVQTELIHGKAASAITQKRSASNRRRVQDCTANGRKNGNEDPPAYTIVGSNSIMRGGKSKARVSSKRKRPPPGKIGIISQLPVNSDPVLTKNATPSSNPQEARILRKNRKSSKNLVSNCLSESGVFSSTFGGNDGPCDLKTRSSKHSTKHCNQQQPTWKNPSENDPNLNACNAVYDADDDDEVVSVDTTMKTATLKNRCRHHTKLTEDEAVMNDEENGDDVDDDDGDVDDEDSVDDENDAGRLEESLVDPLQLRCDLVKSHAVFFPEWSDIPSDFPHELVGDSSITETNKRIVNWTFLEETSPEHTMMSESQSKPSLSFPMQYLHYTSQTQHLYPFHTIAYPDLIGSCGVPFAEPLNDAESTGHSLPNPQTQTKTDLGSPHRLGPSVPAKTEEVGHCTRKSNKKSLSEQPNHRNSKITKNETVVSRRLCKSTGNLRNMMSDPMKNRLPFSLDGLKHRWILDDVRRLIDPEDVLSRTVYDLDEVILTTVRDIHQQLAVNNSLPVRLSHLSASLNRQLTLRESEYFNCSFNSVLNPEERTSHSFPNLLHRTYTSTTNTSEKVRSPAPTRVHSQQSQLQPQIRRGISVNTDCGNHGDCYLTNDDETRVNCFDVDKGHLTFESRFESGNLRKVIQIRQYEYDLILNPDVNTVTNVQWFYFRLSNMEACIDYRFNVINCEKPSSQFTAGMQPLLFSVREALLGRPFWRRVGKSVNYYQNHFIRASRNNSKRANEGNTYFTASFLLQFPHAGDVCYLAYHYPYTYTRLLTDLGHWENTVRDGPSSLYFRVQTLTKTILGNPVPVLTITQRPDVQRVEGDGSNRVGQRPYIFLTARVHSGESNSSWVIKGLIDRLVSDHDPAMTQLRERYIFKIIPMLNPDGVICGNHRCSMVGKDLNRRWLNPSADLHPTIHHAKKLLQLLHLCGRQPYIYIDFHGHSRMKNIFLYGCSPLQSWRNPDTKNPTFRYGEGGNTEDGLYRHLAEVLDKVAPAFAKESCMYTVNKVKESTARVAVWRDFDVIRSYTIEASYCGLTKMLKHPACASNATQYPQGIQLNPDYLCEFGQHLLDAFVLLPDYDNQHPSSLESKDSDKPVMSPDLIDNIILSPIRDCSSATSHFSALSTPSSISLLSSPSLSSASSVSSLKIGI